MSDSPSRDLLTYATLLEQSGRVLVENAQLRDEINRLRRDRVLLLTAAVEALTAHGRIDLGRERWDDALKQLDEVAYDLERRRAGDGRPVAYYYCELESGHAGNCHIRPHEQRIIHGPVRPELQEEELEQHGHSS